MRKLAKNVLDDMIFEIQQEGKILYEYPVDESQDNSNAGDAVEYSYKGKRYEIITWNSRAIEYKRGQQTISKL